MKYWDMIKVDGKTSSPTLTSSCNNQDDNENNDMIKELNCSISELKTMIAGMASGGHNGNSAFPDATLTDEEVDNVLTWLIGFHEKYFKLVPLTDTLTAKFLWNIPREVYKSASLAVIKELPDCLNPIFWFYALCLDDIDAMLPAFILTAINSITSDNAICAYIEEQTDAYKREYLTMDIEEDEEEEEDVDLPPDNDNDHGESEPNVEDDEAPVIHGVEDIDIDAIIDAATEGFVKD